MAKGKKPTQASDRAYSRYLLRRNRLLRALVIPVTTSILSEAEEAEEAAELAGLPPGSFVGVGVVASRLQGAISVTQRVWLEQNPVDPRDILDIGRRVDRQTTAQVSYSLGQPIQAINALKQPFAENAIDWVRENVDKIKTIEASTFSEISDLVYKAVAEGTNTSVLSEQISGRFGVERSRAKFIARDQIAALNGRLTAEKCQSLGVTRFEWSDSGDSRVRDSHTELDGKIFYFDSPPVTNKYGDTNLPGGDYNCRCVAIPIIDD